MIKVITRALVIVALFSNLLLTGQGFAVEKGSQEEYIHLQILTVNDFHGALAENGKNIGAAKLAQFLIERKGQDPRGTLLLSAGDMFQGSLDSNLLYGKPVVNVMNYTAFDAMTLGNHEFDWGTSILKERITQSQFPYLCANIVNQDTGKPIEFAKPYIILERKGVKIGLIGIATPDTAIKTSPQVVGNYTFLDPAKVVNDLVPEVKEKGAEIIIVLTHLASAMDGEGNITGDAALFAQQIKGVDGIVSGHSHQIVYGQVNEIPIVQAAYNGRAVGKMELFFNKNSRKIEQSIPSVILLPYPGLLADSKIEKMLDQVELEIGSVKNIAVGKTLSTLSHDRYEPNVTQLGQWVTDTMRQATGADIAFQNTGGLRTGIATGRITMGNLYEVIPFDNTLYTLEMTGKQIMQVLEYGLMNDKIGMLQYSGIKVVYQIDTSPKGHIVSVSMAGGIPLALNQKYKVVTNDFMAGGGDGYTFFREGEKIHDTCSTVRDILADAIRSQKVIHFTGDDRFESRGSAQSNQQDAA